MSEIVYLEYYTDGACTKQGDGGIGILKIMNSEVHTLHTSRSGNTTNNQMELLGFYLAIKDILLISSNKDIEIKATIYTDSQYVSKGITEWLPNWKKNNWKNSSRKVVLNQDLWRPCDVIYENIKANPNISLNVQWVKGHANNPGNEVADFLSNVDIAYIHSIVNDKDLLVELCNEFIPELPNYSLAKDVKVTCNVVPSHLEILVDSYI